MFSPPTSDVTNPRDRAAAERSASATTVSPSLAGRNPKRSSTSRLASRVTARVDRAAEDRDVIEISSDDGEDSVRSTKRRKVEPSLFPPPAQVLDVRIH